LFNATFFHWIWKPKKKLKTFRDYPIFITHLATNSPKAEQTPPPSTTSNPTNTKIRQYPKTTISESPEPTHSLQQTDSSKRRRKSMIRIKPQEVEAKEEVVIYYGDAPFTSDDLISKWNVYSSNMKQTVGGFSASVLAGCEPILLDDQKTIHLVFRNETNEIEFIRLSLDLIEYLKSELKNNHINFTTEVNEQKAKKVLYTNKDKFDHFSEKYPQLIDWAEKFKLELK
jgi:DNA polymerase-3 subunit gamma/tau